MEDYKIETDNFDLDDLKNFELPKPIKVTVTKNDKGEEVMNMTETTESEIVSEALGLTSDVITKEVKEEINIEEAIEDIFTIGETPVIDTVEETPVKLELKEEVKTEDHIDLKEVNEATDAEINDVLGLDIIVEEEDSFLSKIDLNLDNEISMVKDEILAYSQQEKPKRVPKKVDISAITITDRNAIQQNGDLKSALYTGKATFSIAATKSGYSANLLPLVHKDAQRILYSSLDPVSQQRETFKIVHEKILESGVARVKGDFNYWLKNTAAEDIDTFYYGIYCSTFPDGGNLQVQCGDCGHATGYTIPHSNLVTVEDPGTKERANTIIREVRDEADMRKYSLINTNESYLLEDSGMIIEVKTPSLADLLDIMRNVREEKIKRDRISVTNMLYIEKILLPNKSISGQYSKVVDRKRILHIVDNLSLDDAELVNAIIGELINTHRLSYTVKGLVCSSCGEQIEAQDFSIEDVLFSAIFAKYQ